jgi:PEP-CTERM motif-containing protein
MRKSMYAVVGAVGLALASGANAAVVITNPTPAVYTPPATGGFIGQVDARADATLATDLTDFNDTFTFTIMGSPGQVNAQVGAISLDHIQNIAFSSIMLDGNAFTLTSAPGAAKQYSCCGVDGLGSVTLGVGDHTINLIGTLAGVDSGSYSGTLNVQPVRGAVPEPATWAMMLLGFGAMGMATRRRGAKNARLLQIA